MEPEILRLLRDLQNGGDGSCFDICGIIEHAVKEKQILQDNWHEAVEENTRLQAETAELKANGLFPPCKVGDTVYYINHNDEILDLQVGIITIELSFVTCHLINDGWVYAKVTMDKLGVNWFLTREEAEKALEGGKNE